MEMPESYAYENRTGVEPISWELFHGLCKGLALAVSDDAPEIILAVGRGGYYPGTLIAHLLRAEIYPVRLSRRVNDIVRHKRPKWLVRPPKWLKNRRVLVVDEICDTGETLQKVTKRARKLGAAQVRTAVLYAHTHAASVPDYVGLITDRLILNPWDREIVVDGQVVMHPEYLGALEQQGITLGPDLRVGAPIIPPAKHPPTDDR
jgi:hypoxanthine phosphoribosyltransferase